MTKKKSNTLLTPSQRLLFRKLRKLRNKVKFGLYHYQGPSSPMTLSWNVETVVSPRASSFTCLPFAEGIEKKMQHYVRQCEAETYAKRQSIIDYVIGRISSRKIMHLMHCSCNCRQLWREAQRRSTNDGTQSQHNCNCCPRHKKL